MLNCRRASELMSQARDEGLSLPRRIQLRIHIMLCHCCSSLEKNMDTVGGLVRDQSAPETDEQWRDDLAERVARKAQEAPSRPDQAKKKPPD